VSGFNDVDLHIVITVGGDMRVFRNCTGHGLAQIVPQGFTHALDESPRFRTLSRHARLSPFWVVGEMDVVSPT
jgi:hypothetical protein